MVANTNATAPIVGLVVLHSWARRLLRETTRCRRRSSGWWWSQVL